MLTKRLTFFAVFLIVMISTSLGICATAVDDALIDMGDFRGQTCYGLLLDPGGLKQGLDADQTSTFTVFEGVNLKNSGEVTKAAQDLVSQLKTKYDHRDYHDLVSIFKDQEDGLQTFLISLASQKLSPSTIREKLVAALKAQGDLADENKLNLDAAIIEPLLLALSGRGVVIKVNSNIYIMAESYKPGNVKSGRTYVKVTGIQEWLDPSDTYFLNEAGTVIKSLKGTADYENLNRAALDMIVKSDPAEMSKLSLPAQALVANLYGIFTAEIRRAEMDGFQSHLWMNDLTEAFLDSVIPVETGMTWDAQKGGLMKGSPENFFGVGTGGSGIGGRMREGRHQFQRLITSAMEQLDPTAVKEVRKYVQGPDLMNGLMTYISKYKSGDKKVVPDADGLISAYVDFMQSVRANASDVIKYIQKNPNGGGTSSEGSKGKGGGSRPKKSK